MASEGKSGDLPHPPNDAFVPHKNHKTPKAATEFRSFHRQSGKFAA